MEKLIMALLAYLFVVLKIGVAFTAFCWCLYVAQQLVHIPQELVFWGVVGVGGTAALSIVVSLYRELR